MEKLILPSKDDFLYQVGDYTIEADKRGKPDLAKTVYFLQNLAIAHVRKLGFGEDYQKEKSFLYVVCRMKGTFYRDLKVGEKITGVTYTLVPNLIDMIRYAYLLDKEEKPVFFLSSLWILLDPKTRRIKPARFYRDDILSKYPKMKENKEREGTHLAALDFHKKGFQKAADYVIAPSDIDANHHMNNTSYLRISKDISAFDSLSSFEIDFEKECFLNEKLSLWKKEEPGKEEIEGRKEDGSLSFKLRFLSR